MYIASCIILAVFLYGMYRQLKSCLRMWNAAVKWPAKVTAGLASLCCVLSFPVWCFLVYWTVHSWMISMDPARPKPFFLIIYVTGLFAVTTLLAFAQLFSSLVAIRK